MPDRLPQGDDWCSTHGVSLAVCSVIGRQCMVPDPDPDACATIRPTGWDGDEDCEPLPHVAVVLRWPAEEPDSIDRKGLAPEHWTWELIDPAGDVILSGYADDDPAAVLQVAVDAFHATILPEPEG